MPVRVEVGYGDAVGADIVPGTCLVYLHGGERDFCLRVRRGVPGGFPFLLRVRHDKKGKTEGIPGRYNAHAYGRDRDFWLFVEREPEILARRVAAAVEITLFASEMLAATSETAF